MAKNSTELLLPGLPDDLGLLCLAKLPIDAVARCRAVSRSWASSLLQSPASRLPQPLACSCIGHMNSGGKTSMAWLFLSRPGLRCLVVPFFRIEAYTSEIQVMPTGTNLLLVRSSLKLSTDFRKPAKKCNRIPGALHCFDLWQMKWCREACDGRQIPPMHVDRRWPFATAHVGKHVYVAGGDYNTVAGGDGSTARRAERLDIKTWRWEVLPEMRKKRHVKPVGFAMGGCFYVAGGEFQLTTGNMEELIQSVEFYDPEKGMWMLVLGMWPGISNVAVVKDEAYTISELSEVMRLRVNGGWEIAGQLPHVPELKWRVVHLVSVDADELWVVFTAKKDAGFHLVLYACNPYLARDGLYWEQLPFNIPPPCDWFGCVDFAGIGI